jgi:hypothetical protein
MERKASEELRVVYFPMKNADMYETPTRGSERGVDNYRVSLIPDFALYKLLAKN